MKQYGGVSKNIGNAAEEYFFNSLSQQKGDTIEVIRNDLRVF